MGFGDVVEAHDSVANNAFLTIQPSAGVEWVIHNIYAGGACEIYKTDSSDNDIKIDENASEHSWCNYSWHVTNTYFIRVKNVSGGAVYLGYDGVQSK